MPWSSRPRQPGFGPSLSTAQALSIEAASNRAIRAVPSRYIVIHDDDDSWQPTFLQRTTSFLDDNPSYGGVITQAMAVTESLTADRVEVVSSRPFNSHLTHLYLIEMLEANCFPPISFLFRRDAYAAVGEFDPALPVLGDWDFNIRFLQKYDIGVVPELLANYHWRVDGQQSGAYGNTIIAGYAQHAANDVMIRNRMLRRDLEAGRFGPGCLMSMLRWQRGALVGEALRARPDGNEAMAHPDGEEAMAHPDGEEAMAHPDGEEAMAHPDGEEAMARPDDPAGCQPADQAAEAPTVRRDGFLRPAPRPFPAPGAADPASTAMAEDGGPGVTAGAGKINRRPRFAGECLPLRRPERRPQLTLTSRVHRQYDCATVIPPSRENVP